MRSVVTRLLAVASIAAATSFSPALHAQSDADRATARQLGQDGEAALDAKDYKAAEDAFRRANRLVHAPTLELGLARALAGLGKFVESQETYNRIVREGVPAGSPAVFHDALEAAKREVDSVGPHIGGVTIVITTPTGSDLPNEKVLLDGQPVNTASLGVRRAIDPGSHVLSVTADGYKPAELKFDVAEGGSVSAPLTLEKDPNAVVAPPPVTPPPVDNRAAFTAQPPTMPPGPEQPPPSSSAVLPWTVLGVGAAGLVLGAITGGIAVGDHSSLSGKCSGGVCGSDQQSAVSSYHTMGVLSTVGFIVGGVGVVGGVVLLLVQPSAPQVPAATTGSSPFTVTPAIGLGSLGATGTF